MRITATARLPAAFHRPLRPATPPPHGLQYPASLARINRSIHRYSIRRSRGICQARAAHPHLRPRTLPLYHVHMAAATTVRLDSTSESIRSHCLYPAAAVMRGTVHWACPDCGDLNRVYIAPPNWRAVCGRPECRKVFYFGLRLWKLPRGRRPAGGYRDCTLRPADVTHAARGQGYLHSVEVWTGETEPDTTTD